MRKDFKGNIYLETPLNKEDLIRLKSGERVYLSGIIYTGRDSAHKRLFSSLEKGENLPVDFSGQVVYYVGPCPAKKDQIIGSCGPTTSGRVDKYTPALLDIGLAAMIGKGERNQEVIDSIVKNKAVYFGATGGAGALISKCVKSKSIVAYEDLGTEAIHKLYVENFPLTVIIDCNGNNLYESERKKYCQM